MATRTQQAVSKVSVDPRHCREKTTKTEHWRRSTTREDQCEATDQLIWHSAVKGHQSACRSPQYLQRMADIQDSQRRLRLRCKGTLQRDNSMVHRAITKVRLTHLRELDIRRKGKDILPDQAVILRREATHKLDRTRTADPTVLVRLKPLAMVDQDLGLLVDSDHHTMPDNLHEQAQ